MKFLSNNTSKFNILDYKVVNNIKSLALDMNGDPNNILNNASIMYDLYAKHMVFDINNSNYVNRDRFIMSSLNNLPLLYATLYFSGFPYTIDDLKNYKELDINSNLGIDYIATSIGEGFVTGVGMAIGERYLNQRYSYGKDSLVNHYTYILCDDKDITSGLIYESSSLASKLNLGKLIVLCSNNSSKDNLLDIFKTMNWDTNTVINGNNLDLIDDAINKAKLITNKPSIIEIKVSNDYNLKYQYDNLNKVYLNEKDISKIKDKMDIRDVSFTILDDAYNYIKEEINLRNNKIINNYNKSLETILPRAKELYRFEFKDFIENKNIIEFNSTNLNLKNKLSLIDNSNLILNEIFKDNSLFLGCISDISSMIGNKCFNNNSYDGRNILFDNNNFIMGYIANGIALSNIKCFVSANLKLFNELSSSIKISSNMKLPVIYIFNDLENEKINLVNELISLRSIPNLLVYKPSDVNELLGTYKSIIKNDKTSVIILNNEDIEISKHTKINGIDKGGYVALDYDKINGILVATGNELNIALKISEMLATKKLYLRVVSMPSIELFKEQNKDYKEKVLPEMTKKAVIEFASSYSWHEFVYNDKYLFNVNEFNVDKNNLTYDNLLNQIEDLFK